MLFADGSLARRLESNKSTGAWEYAQAQESQRPGTTATLSIAGGNAVFVGAASPISRAMGLGMGQPVTAVDLDTVEEFFRTRGASPRLELCPLAHPSLLELVGVRGYRIAHFRNVLVRPLERGAALPPVTTPAMIRRAEEPAVKRHWLYTVARGFLGRDEITTEETWIPEPMTGVDAISCYLAYLDDEPVGGGAVGIRGGLAFLSSASVRSAYRGQGIQSALIQRRLSDAAEAGCDLAMVECTPGSPSQRNLERFGFRVAYTTMAVVKD